MICLIGNSGLSKHGIDGQTAKVRLYLKKLKDEGFEVFFIDLENFIKRPISILLKIKKAVKECSRIILISAERGCKILIPYINWLNKKYMKPFILPLVGSSVLHYSIDSLSKKDQMDFLVNGKYDCCGKPKKMARCLSKITYILPETKALSDTFSSFYRLNNIVTLPNFRESSVFERTNCIDNNSLRLIFISRVMREKGIFDLIDAINCLDKKGYTIQLDIYGQLIMSKKEKETFYNSLSNSIRYFGKIAFDGVVDTLRNYDLFVFPTRFMFEGVPGVVVEALLSGTPILTSNFPQASFILNENYDSLFFDMGNSKDLEKKLIYIYNNKSFLEKLKSGAAKTGDTYRYNNVRSLFLEYVCGLDSKEVAR